jgi:hypothetical protein
VDSTQVSEPWRTPWSAVAHERPDPSDAKTWDDLLPSEEKNTRGLEKIRHLPVATPAESLKHIAKPPKSQTRTRS